MAGRTPQQAVKAFLEPIRLALSCVTTAQVSRTGDAGDTEHALLLADGQPGALRCTRDGPLAIRVTQQYRVVRAAVVVEAFALPPRPISLPPIRLITALLSKTLRGVGTSR